MFPYSNCGVPMFCKGLEMFLADTFVNVFLMIPIVRLALLVV